MAERLIDRNASNWVDRGQAPEPELERVLGFYLERPPTAPDTELREYVTAIRGMVEADASEVQIAGYLHELERRLGLEERPGGRRRGAAITLWHVAKCAELRERARRLLEVAAAR